MALTYNDVMTYSDKVKGVTGRAVAELRESLSRIDSSDPYTRAYATRRHVMRVAERYGMQEQELGAQWYEYCAKAAGVDVEPAIVEEIDYGELDRYYQTVLQGYTEGDETWEEIEPRVIDSFESQMRGYERNTIISNLDRDHRQEGRRWRQTRRAAMKAGYARVPVGETCAWCYMLASLGYYYRSEETALGAEPDHYHYHCDCIAVPYNGPDAIEGYDDYEMYFDMYSSARDAYYAGNYSADVAARIERAHAKHDEDYRSGKTDVPWADINAITIVMRDQQGLSH